MSLVMGKVCTFTGGTMMPAILPNPLDNPITVPDLDHMCYLHTCANTCITHIPGQNTDYTPPLTKISKFESVRFLSMPVWCHGEPSHGVPRINCPIEKEAEQNLHELLQFQYF